MDFLIKPGEGFNDMRFGMSPGKVRRVIGEKWESFKRSQDSEHPCDYFKSLGVFVYYKASGEAEAVEFAMPAEVIFEGADLLQLSFVNLIGLLQKRDSNVEVDSDGLTAYGLGIGAYAPSAAEEPMAKAEGIIIFEKGYYG